MTDEKRMRFSVSTEPIDGFVVGRSYNHAQHVCSNGHDECAERPGGRCIDDVVFICASCRGKLIGSEIEHGRCGDCRTAPLRSQLR